MPLRVLAFFLAALVVAIAETPAAEPATLPRVPPTEPQDVASKFHIQHGFRMDLLAAEPLTTDPVAITYDEDGRA